MHSNRLVHSTGGSTGCSKWRRPLLGVLLVALILVLAGSAARLPEWRRVTGSDPLTDDPLAVSMVGVGLSSGLPALLLLLAGMGLLAVITLAYYRELLAKRRAQDQLQRVNEELQRHVSLQTEGIVAGGAERQAAEDRWLSGRARVEGDEAGRPQRMQGVRVDIDASKRNEEEQHRNDARLLAIIDAAPFGAHSYRLDADGRLVFVGYNQAADRILGIDHRALLDKSIEEAFPSLIGTPVPDSYRKVALTGERVEFEQVFYSEGRTQGTFEIQAFQTAQNRMTVFFRDTTERKKAEDALARERVFTNAIMDSVPGLLYVYDTEGRLVRWNKQHEVITGYSAEELSRMQLLDWYPDSPEDIERITRSVQKAFVEGYAEAEGNLRTKFGTHILFNFTAVRLEIDGQTYIAGIGVDISARRKAEEEIRHLNELLEERVRQRTAELEAANQELESFSYSVSHDLRAPLRALDGFSLALLEDYGGVLNAQGKHFVDQIRQGAGRMNALIEDLLRLSRLGRSVLHRQQVDTGALVQEALDMLDARNQAPRLQVKIGVLPPCQGDPALLKQVWVNLLSNALKYSRQRDPAIIEVGCEQGAQAAVFFVRDNGVGFDMKYASKLFQVFQRLHGQEEFEGNGVGLALVRQIVTRHGGRVWAESVLGQGTCFRFSLSSHSEGATP